MKKKAILSLSGGMDSTGLLTNLLYEGYDVRAYSFDYGQKHKIELERVKRNIDYLIGEGFNVEWRIIDVKSIFDQSNSALTSDTKVPEGHYAEQSMSKTVVEGRNSLFSTIIFIKACNWVKETGEDVKISLGIHSGDHAIYKDCRPEFRDAMEIALKLGADEGDKIEYYTPFLLGNKTFILKDTIKNCEDLSLNFETILGNTNTCYQPDELGRSCGKCGSCVERVEAFIEVNKIDSVEYQDIWDIVKENVISILSQD